jgi:hypothetical protein
MIIMVTTMTITPTSSPQATFPLRAVESSREGQRGGGVYNRASGRHHARKARVSLYYTFYVVRCCKG